MQFRWLYASIASLILWGMAQASVAQTAAKNRTPVDYYKVINDKNLFRPLGWTPPNPAPQYTLLLTAVAEPEATTGQEGEDFWEGVLGRTPPKRSPSPKPKPSRALIVQAGSNAIFYVAAGEKVGNFRVASIEKGHVRLESEGGKEKLELRLAEMNLGGGGAPSPPTGTPPPQMGPPPGPPPGGGRFAEMRARFRSMSPEERARMRQEFGERLKNMSPEEREKTIQDFGGKLEIEER